jgi:hypothetical protein
MVEILDAFWWGVIALAFVVLVVAARMRGGGGEPGPAADDADAYEPEPMTLGDWRNEHEGRQAPRGGGWVECFCCGCPALDEEEEDFPTCAVCGWDGDVDGIESARINFQHHGSVHAPGEGAAAVSAPERTLALELAAACAVVPEGEAPPPEFWPAFYERLDALERARAAPRGVMG